MRVCARACVCVYRVVEEVSRVVGLPREALPHGLIRLRPTRVCRRVRACVYVHARDCVTYMYTQQVHYDTRTHTHRLVPFGGGLVVEEAEALRHVAEVGGLIVCVCV